MALTPSKTAKHQQISSSPKEKNQNLDSPQRWLKNISTSAKACLHPRNRHKGQYDFVRLIECSPELAKFVQLNAFNNPSINFANPQAVIALNRALLKSYYGILNWSIPVQYLCPPIPGRVDYIHYVADLISISNNGIILKGRDIRVFDVGVGANAIYPLLGHSEYDWQFVGSEIDSIALNNARHLLYLNNIKSDAIELRFQYSPLSIFNGLIKQHEFFDLTICNPPFHKSLEEARKGTQRKWQNLGKASLSEQDPVLNFGGLSSELYCLGGEVAFVSQMINESKKFANNIFWFTTLVSKATTLPIVYRVLKNVNAVEVKTINMAQGQKKSRIVAWTFFDNQQQRAWIKSKLRNQV